MSALIYDLQRLAPPDDRPLLVARGWLPAYVAVNPAHMRRVGRFEVFLPLVNPAVEVVDEANAEYRVTAQGHLVAATKLR
jgi:hypothetical protein